VCTSESLRESRRNEEQCKRSRGDPFVPPNDERNAGDKLQRAPGNDERRHERCWSAVGSKLVGGSRLVHNAESVFSLMCGDQMSDGGWRRGDVKPSNALLDGAITQGDALMLP